MPTTSKFTLILKNFRAKTSIYNVLGKEVLSLNNTDSVKLEVLPKGVYTIRISDGVRQTNKKFIKN